MKHKRDFKALEKRRLKGAQLLAHGVSKPEVARQLGVTRQTVATWELRLAEDGSAANKRQARRPLMIIWDGATTHRSRKVKAWLEEPKGHVAVARLPPYAPELNPVEAIRACLKKHEIANLCLNAIGKVGHFTRNRLKFMQRRPHLVAAFWKQTEPAF